jgi:hypothetical protein
LQLCGEHRTRASAFAREYCVRCGIACWPAFVIRLKFKPSPKVLLPEASSSKAFQNTVSSTKWMKQRDGKERRALWGMVSIARAVAAGRTTIHRESFSIPGIAIKRGGLALPLALQPLPQLKPLLYLTPSKPTTHPLSLHQIIAADILDATTHPPPVCAPPTWTAIFVTTALPHQHPRLPSFPRLTTTTDITTTNHIITTRAIAAALARIRHRATIEVILRDTTFGAPFPRPVSHIAIPNIRAQGRQDLRNHHTSAWLRGVRTHRTPNLVVAADRIRTSPTTALTRET